jgi:hypothetical protein
MNPCEVVEPPESKVNPDKENATGKEVADVHCPVVSVQMKLTVAGVLQTMVVLPTPAPLNHTARRNMKDVPLSHTHVPGGICNVSPSFATLSM